MKYWDWWTERKGESDSIMKKVSTRCHTLWPISQPIYPSIHPSIHWPSCTGHYTGILHYTSTTSKLSLTHSLLLRLSAHLLNTHTCVSYCCHSLPKHVSAQPRSASLRSAQLSSAHIHINLEYKAIQHDTISMPSEPQPQVPTYISFRELLHINSSSNPSISRIRIRILIPS